MADWKINVIFYSGLHGINYWFDKNTGRAPESHLERNRQVQRELSHVFVYYKELYTASGRARYCDGYRVTDDRRRSAYAALRMIEKALPF